MSIGTSLGAYFDDDFHYQASQWDPKYDTNEYDPGEVQQKIEAQPAKVTPVSDRIDVYQGEVPKTDSVSFLSAGKALNSVIDSTIGALSDPMKTVNSIAETAKNALTLPGDVMSGKIKAGSQEEIEGAANLAGFISGSPAATGEKATLGAGSKYDAYINMFTKKADTVEPTLSAKDAYMKGVQETHQNLMSSLDDIKNQYLENAKKPIEAVRGYDTPAYRGLTVHGDADLSSTYDFKKYTPEMYSTKSPLLADMYAGYLDHHPGMEVPPGTFPSGSGVMPLLINTKNYHYYDANGKTFIHANDYAIKEAKEAGKPGVIVDNVWDEPNNTKALGKPKRVYITFPEGASTVKSRFAKSFDPKSPDMMHSVAGLGVGGAAGYVSLHDMNEEQ